MSNTKLNGAPRKQLSEQLDRLDTIIDALDEGLKGAVADAVREAVAVAVQEAVQAVVREPLANPDVLRAVTGAAQPQPAPSSQQPAAQQTQPGQGILSGVRGRVSRAWNAAVAVLSFAAAWALSAASALRPAAIWLRQACQFVWRHRLVAGSSLAVGLAVGVLSYLSGPTVSSAALGVCGTAMSAVTFIILPFTNLWAWLTRRAA